MTDSNRQAWEKPGYSDVIAAAQTESGVEVRFANGDTVTVSPGLLGVSAANFSVQVDSEDTTRVRVIAGTNVRDVDWTVIRAASDAAFARELRDRDTEESRRIARRLRALREDRGIAQAAVAKLVDMPPSQLAKLEKGESDMRLSTVGSLLRALDASFADISGPDAPEVSVKVLSRLAKKAGAPEPVLRRILAQVSRSQFAAALTRGFGWSAEELDSGQLGVLALAGPVRFKSRSAQPQDSPLLPLAHTISAISAWVCEKPVAAVPEDPADLRRALLPDGHGRVTLELLLSWSWSAGMLVIPMAGSSGFSAAVWTVEGRPVIVLKETRGMIAYWLFDLAHELGHIALGHLAQGSVVDLSNPSPADTTDAQERAANEYALALVAPGHERLLAAVRERSEADGPNLFKGAVESVAAEADLSPELLGVIASYALTDIADDNSRWGSTENIGKLEGSGRELAEAHFAGNISLDGMKTLDAGLIRALVLSS